MCTVVYIGQLVSNNSLSPNQWRLSSLHICTSVKPLPVKIHCGLVTTYGNIDLDQYWPKKFGMLPDSTKPLPETWFTPDILKMGSWNHMGCTGNMIIKDVVRQMFPFYKENSAYFGDGDGINSNPPEPMLPNHPWGLEVIWGQFHRKCWRYSSLICVLKSLISIIVAWWRHMATEIWVNIGSGNGLLPDGTKPLPEPMLTYH